MITSSNIGSATAPLAPVAGDLWFDTANTSLKIYDGAAWLIIPAAPAPAANQVLTSDPAGIPTWVDINSLP